MAYDAAHDAGEAMLAAYGYRTVRGPGQHEALGRFLVAVFDAPPQIAAAAAHYDQMRRDRNRQRYSAQTPTKAAASEGARSARALLEAAAERLW